MQIDNSKCVLVASLIGATIQIIMCDVKNSKFTKFYGIPVLSTRFTPSTPILSPTFKTCIAMCSRQNSCYIVNYNQELSTCITMHWRAVEIVRIPRNDTGKTKNIAMKAGTKQLYLRNTDGRYKFTFAEAEPLCQRVGGLLSEDKDVILARDNEYWGVCGCGWVTNGSAVYHLNEYEVSECEGVKDNVCEFSPTYDVHCTVL